MHAYQQKFIQFALAHRVLRFGQFTLKSGRLSPYFFNAGEFCSGTSLAALGRFYAHAITASKQPFDMLFGPAYKGIPLVASTAIALAEEYGINYPWCCNRKETKDHGEGGALLGAPLRGRVLVVDDVITAGTAIGESASLIRAQGAELMGVAIALDRQERGSDGSSVVQEVERRYGATVINIATITDVIDFMRTSLLSENSGATTANACNDAQQIIPFNAAQLAAVERYRADYGTLC